MKEKLVTSTSAQIVAPGNYDFIHIKNISDADVYVAYDGDIVATVADGMIVPANGGTLTLDEFGPRKIYGKGIYAIHNTSGNKALRIAGISALLMLMLSLLNCPAAISGGGPLGDGVPSTIATNAIGNSQGFGTNATLIDTTTVTGNIHVSGTNTAKEIIASSNLLSANFCFELTNTVGGLVNINQAGVLALATGDSLAVGNGSRADDHSTALGIGTTSLGAANSLGEGATAYNNSISFGNFATAIQDTVALGDTITASTNSVAVGVNSAAKNSSVAIGPQTDTGGGKSNIVIGVSAIITGTRTNAMQFGKGTLAKNDFFQLGGGNAANGFDCDLSSGTIACNIASFNTQFASDNSTIFSAGDGTGTLNANKFTALGSPGFDGDGSAISAINAANVSSGTLPVARGPGITTNITFTTTTPAGSFTLRITNGIIMKFN